MVTLCRYDIMRNGGRNTKSLAYFIVLQSEYSRTTELVIVAPIYTVDFNGLLVDKIHISVVIEEISLVISLEELGAVSAHNFSGRIGNFDELDCDIGKGLDFLLKGI